MKQACQYCPPNAANRYHAPDMPCGLQTRDWDARYWLVGTRLDGTTYIRWSGQTLQGAERHRARLAIPQAYSIIERNPA